MTTSAPTRSRLRGVHPGWWVALAGFCTLLAASGFRAAPGVLIVPLHDEFGWSRATVSVAVSVNLVLFGLSGPFTASLMGRFGVRRTVSCALVLVALGSALTVVMQTSWELILFWGVLVGAGTGAAAPVLAATIANRWFVAHRGLITGVLTAATSTGQLAFLPALSWLAVGPGWRWASATVAAAALAAALLAARFLREYPGDVGREPVGATGAGDVVARRDAPGAGTALSTLRAVRRARAFWLLAGSFFICGATTNGLIATHFIPAAMDHDIPEVAAAGMLAAMGVLDIVGTTASGWLTDRFAPQRLLFWYYALRGLSLLMLPHALAHHHLPLVAFVAFYGLDWIATVPPTVALCTRVFGADRAGVVFGWVFCAHQLGAAVAATGAGTIRTVVGDYEPAFITAGGLCLLAAAIVLRISNRPFAPAGGWTAAAPGPAVAAGHA